MSSHPRPVADAETAPFWASCDAQRLSLQRCAACAAWRFPPRPRCAECGSRQAVWEEVAGRGTIASWTMCYPPVLPAFAERVPYNAIVVQLEEGPFMVSNLVEFDEDQLRVGQPVEVVFATFDGDVILPQFRPSDQL